MVLSQLHVVKRSKNNSIGSLLPRRATHSVSFRPSDLNNIIPAILRVGNSVITFRKKILKSFVRFCRKRYHLYLNYSFLSAIILQKVSEILIEVCYNSTIIKLQS